MKPIFSLFWKTNCFWSFVILENITQFKLFFPFLFWSRHPNGLIAFRTETWDAIHMLIDLRLSILKTNKILPFGARVVLEILLEIILTSCHHSVWSHLTFASIPCCFWECTVLDRCPGNECANRNKNIYLQQGQLRVIHLSQVQFLRWAEGILISVLQARWGVILFSVHCCRSGENANYYSVGSSRSNQITPVTLQLQSCVILWLTGK